MRWKPRRGVKMPDPTDTHPTSTHHPQPAMNYKTTIESASLAEPVESIVQAANAHEARLKALRRWAGNRKICMFNAANPLPGQDPSGQGGYGYESARPSSGCTYSAATGFVRVYMEPC